ncbi:MAG: hypothetical protein Q4C36_03075 [Coriobacteriia bacterium]|nr:hypothetical protein [Coriobacteriia bacterium]
MRKQTIASLIVGAALLIAAVVYTLLYAYFDLQYVDCWQRILLIVLLMVIAAAMVALFVNRSHLREEMVRRYYLSPEWVYNHEIGYAPLSQAAPNGDAYEFVTFAADALIEMSYGFEVAETPRTSNRNTWFPPRYSGCAKPATAPWSRSGRARCTAWYRTRTAPCKACLRRWNTKIALPEPVVHSS